MKKLQIFNVSPSLPTSLAFLETLSRNLWWSWNQDAIDLFRRVDPELWHDASHNPVVFFSRVPQDRLEALAHDDGFMSHLDEVRERFENEVTNALPVDAGAGKKSCIAYFSLEYGIHEILRLYSGGLGCLAGDHLKSASDLGIPLVAVGMFYRCGYFQQYLNEDGWQQEACVENEIQNLPLTRAVDIHDRPVEVALPLPEGVLHAAVWRVDVGRVPLYLLDTNVVKNPPEFKSICTHLYDADRQIRLRQELLLGIGGFRALVALGYELQVCHMNEGHAAFAGLARVKHLMDEQGLTREKAGEVVRRTNVFTTHTPVPAGNETFAVDLVKRHLHALEEDLGVDADTVLALGRAPTGAKGAELTMTVLALRMSNLANGVSRLHGRVSRNMWKHLWVERPEDEIPIGHVTNGVHVQSWLSSDFAVLFDRYLGPEWRDTPSSKDVLARIPGIPAEVIWHAMQLGRSRLVRAAREYGERQMLARNAARSEIAQVKSVLRADTLTIGFARRFAAYKRATLLLKNPERLEALLTSKDRPVQIVFAGKAHPADDVGKNFIREIVHFARRAGLRQKIIFIENYSIRIARYMVQGADVWLNNPRRPQEASGTSGMKAALNGALHVSIPDGWWDEAYTPECGWAIGHGEIYANPDYQDTVESQALYNALENEVVPAFYERSENDLPMAWIEMMKASIAMALGKLSSHRMVSEYADQLYGPAHREWFSLTENEWARAEAIVKQQARFNSLWSAVRVDSPRTDREIASLHVGDSFTVTVPVHLGDLSPEEVSVELYYGPVSGRSEITESNAVEMELAEDLGKGDCVYRQKIECRNTGRHGLTARAIPRGDACNGLIPGFIAWAEES
ncbi:alpha-glucan family phosphorylase [Verrucomicrobiota bacterium]